MRHTAQVLLSIIALAALGRALAAPPPAREIDVRRAEAAGLRVIDGRYLRLVTDLPSSDAVDDLPAVFDAAVPLWAAYFGVKESQLARSRWTAFLIDDRERFAALDLLPADNPNFVNGYARDYELWLVEQPSDYYRRHLLLHEGTHGFMQTQLGGAGPGWYMEGMAELLGTHEWRNGRLRLNVIPPNRESVPMWGRVKIIREAFAAKKVWPMEAVLAVDNTRALSTEHYAWTWALAALLDGHPAYQQRFRELKTIVAADDFNDRFRKAFAKDWPELVAEWNAYVAQLDYGYDMQRMAIVHRPPNMASRPGRGALTINANRGWQATGWILMGGHSYQFTASGRFQIATDPDGTPWPCEPGGVIIEYHDGRPLGMLLGALRPTDGGPGNFATPVSIGVGATLRPDEDSFLYLRVNDNPAKLADNAGELTIRIERNN